MNPKQYLIDTNILIDYLKNKQESVIFLEGLSLSPVISVITVAELYAGAKKKEEKYLKQFFDSFNIIPVDFKIAKNGGLLRNQYYKSHGLCLYDGLIAATALINNFKLASLNIKHFPMIKDVERPY